MQAVLSTILMTAIVACHSLVATHVHFGMAHEGSHSHGQQPHFHLFGGGPHSHSHPHPHHGHAHSRHHGHETEKAPRSQDGQLPDGDSDSTTYHFVDSTVTSSQKLQSTEDSSRFPMLLVVPCLEFDVADLIDATDVRWVSLADRSTARIPRYLRDCSIRC